MRLLSPVLLVCFWCVCIVLFRVCIALSCECILLSAFNGYFIRFLFSFNRDFIRFFYRFLSGLYSLFNTLFWCMYSFLIQLLQVAYKNAIPNTVKLDFSAKLFIRIKYNFLMP